MKKKRVIQYHTKKESSSEINKERSIHAVKQKIIPVPIIVRTTIQ